MSKLLFAATFFLSLSLQGSPSPKMSCDYQCTAVDKFDLTFIALGFSYEMQEPASVCHYAEDNAYLNALELCRENSQAPESCFVSDHDCIEVEP